MSDLRHCDGYAHRNSDRVRRHTDRQLDVYGCVRKNDLWIKDDYGNTCGTTCDDSTSCDHHCLRRDTNSIDTYIYKWT